MFPGIGVLPGPATESHIVNRGTPVAPLGQPQLNVPETKSHPRGKPLQPWVTVEGCCVWDLKKRFRYFSQLNLAPNDPVGVQDAVNFYVRILAKGVKAGKLNKIFNEIRNVFALRQVSLRVTYTMPRPQREV